MTAPPDADAAKWRECADELANVAREWITLGERNFMVTGLLERQYAALARYDALRKETERG